MGGIGCPSYIWEVVPIRIRSGGGQGEEDRGYSGGTKPAVGVRGVGEREREGVEIGNVNPAGIAKNSDIRGVGEIGLRAEGQGGDNGNYRHWQGQGSGRWC
jgi:hypothetical protein